MGACRSQSNKPHKTRFSSKASRHLHKTSATDKKRISKSDHNVGKGAKTARLQRNKMLRDQKKEAVLKEKRASNGSTSAPRVIVLFGLSAAVELDSLAGDVLSLLSAESSVVQSMTVASSEYKMRATVLKAPHGDIQSCIEMAKVADLIAFVASASYACEEDNTSNYIDSFGSQCLSVFRSIGLPSTVVLIRDLPTEMKRRQQMKKMCTTELASEFPEDCKFYAADTEDELHKFMWLFKEQRLSAPHWRSQRAYLMSHKVDMIEDVGNPGKCTLLLTGYLRGRNLSVNQLVHVSGAGDYQLCKIDNLKDPYPLNARKGQDMMDMDETNGIEIVQSLVPDPLKQEALLVENIPDPIAGEQTWPTEAEIAEADANLIKTRLRRKALPPGTSEYQAAWIVDDTDDENDEDSHDEDDEDGRGEDDVMALDSSREFILQNKSDISDDEASLNLDDKTDVDSVMMDTDNITREQLEDELQKLKKEHADDEEFPDEVDTPLDIPARRRFARYRGVKSLRTSSWDPKESLPADYAKIFAFDNFKRTQKLVLAKALGMEQDRDECVSANSYVRLYLKEVPNSVASKLCELGIRMPIIACALMQHESKMSVLHFSIKKHDSYSEPIKAKEELVFHVGFRQFVARPVYSTDSMKSTDKHKMERFLHPGCFSVASIYAPISFPQLPLIALKYAREDAAPVVVASGSLKNIDPDRITLKKIILTGYPQRVSKMKASVRYMFHSPEDVRWFKPVEVFTKCGRRGRIKEPVGTHGFMKCIFNGVLQQHDTVCMPLYKRVYPKWPEHLYLIR